jgi:DNA-binding MarR family transcriptional regulator
MRPLFVRRAEAFQMNINELRVLTTLARMGEAASHELCEVAGIHPMNVSRAVGVLRAQGRVEERRDEDNRRRKLLRLTPEGKRIIGEMKPDGRTAAERLFEGLDEKALLQLSATIDRMTENALAEK